ncbi:MAG: DUF6659 family protein [Nitrosopumilus sp.]
MTRKKLTILQSSQLNILENNCNLILKYNVVKFVGVINYLGNLIAGGFKKGITPMGNENIRRMMYMQLKLDLTMRKDYDEFFGPVDYVVSKRGKITKISIPIKKYMIVLIISKDMNYESVIKKTDNIFKSSLGDF